MSNLAEKDGKHVFTMNVFVNLSFARDNNVKNPLKSFSCCVHHVMFSNNSQFRSCLVVLFSLKTTSAKFENSLIHENV